jgi:hypothetical protein
MTKIVIYSQGCIMGIPIAPSTDPAFVFWPVSDRAVHSRQEPRDSNDRSYDDEAGGGTKARIVEVMEVVVLHFEVFMIADDWSASRPPRNPGLRHTSGSQTAKGGFC